MRTTSNKNKLGKDAMNLQVYFVKTLKPEKFNSAFIPFNEKLTGIS